MPYYIISFLFFTQLSFGQLLSNDSLLITPIYDHQFNSINGGLEWQIAAQLQGQSLDSLLEKGVIRREDMVGVALPMGIYQNELPIDFGRGMRDMWASKTGWMAKRKEQVSVDVMQSAMAAWAVMEDSLTYTDLQAYRMDMVMPVYEDMLQMHIEMRSLYSEERATFMDIIIRNMSPNVILGYNIQELMPPTHMLEDKVTIKTVNPLFKVYFYDLLLQEAGQEFIAYFPARYDFANSFGPFQFTNIALKDIQVNTRLADAFKAYTNMRDLKNLDDHIRAAYCFSYNNWERLSYNLKLDGTIQQFNDYFIDAEYDIQKQRALRILIAGMTACMHHQPSKARSAMRNYLREYLALEQIHFNIMPHYGDDQLIKYYQSSAEAYLILKVYHKLFPDE